VPMDTTDIESDQENVKPVKKKRKRTSKSADVGVQLGRIDKKLQRVMKKLSALVQDIDCTPEVAQKLDSCLKKTR